MSQNIYSEISKEMAGWISSTMGFMDSIYEGQSMDPLDMFDSNSSLKKAQTVLKSGQKIFQSIMKEFSQPENIESALKGSENLPEYLMDVASQAMSNGVEYQNKIFEKTEGLFENMKSFTPEAMNQDFFQKMFEIYENEFQKIFKIPPVGLTRFYQERINDFVDKQNVFQTSISEFIYTFFLPIQKANEVLQQKIEEQAENGELSDDIKDYYKMWIKILESHYEEFLKSPEYVNILSKTIESLAKYRKAKDAVFTDAIKQLPIPTNKDMDELYKEIYLLKKKVRELNKKLEDN